MVSSGKYNVPLALDGTDGTSEYPTPKTSRSSSSYTEGRGQRQNQTSSELDSQRRALRSSSRMNLQRSTIVNSPASQHGFRRSAFSTTKQ